MAPDAPRNRPRVRRLAAEGSNIDTRPELSVVAPVYNEIDVIREFHRRVTDVLKGAIAYELILVDDGSTDGSLEVLSELAASDDAVRVLSFSRNFGHQAAITAGLDAARGDAVATIDADLQDPPELILDMLERWRAGVDVVYGLRVDRRDQRRSKLLATSVYYWLVDRLSDVDIPAQTGDFRLMDRCVVDVIGNMREENRYVRGMVAWAGFEQQALEYQRPERDLGESKYTLAKLLKLAFDGMTSFSERPLRLATAIGASITVLSFIYTFTIILLYAFDAVDAPPGYMSLLGAITFLAGVQLITIGILGTYVGRIYRETKRRPLYVVSKELS